MTTGELPHVALLAVSFLSFVHVAVWYLELQVSAIDFRFKKYCSGVY